MPIEQVFETAEAVPDFLKNSVAEENGKYVFRAETATEVAGLKTALESERKTKTLLEKSLKGFEGIDADKARKAIEDAQKAEAEKLKTQGDWDAREAQLKTQLQEQFLKEKTPLEERAKLLESAVEKHLKVAVATNAIAEAGGSPELLLPHVLNHISVVEENGEFVARVMQNGQPRIGDAKGNPMSISQLIETDFLNNKIFAPAFAASKAGGSGAGHNTTGAGGVHRISRADAKNAQAYQQAAEAAQKAGAQLIIGD